MIKPFLPVFLIIAFCCKTAAAGDIVTLADCAAEVFKEISTTRKWSGRTPPSCNAKIAVEKRQDGLFVTVWNFRSSSEGWNSVSFSGAMGYSEIAAKKQLQKAGRDMRSRAVRLDRCLESILRDNDPQQCRDRATKSYLGGETTGIENRRLIWLDDNGRHTVAEHAFGNSSFSPSPPADLFGGERVLPGIILRLNMR